MKLIGLAADHAGFELKEYVKRWLAEKGLNCKDFGTDSDASVDYPDYAHPLASAVEAGECYPGIAICGSGNGISMTLNKHQASAPLFAGTRKSPAWHGCTTTPTCW
ncbi:ribose 5-phosphate isomerase B [Bacteroides pyogenes JCM 6292]|uniref:Ribose 5-phosphate isomerase B n=1 Tax=Bacteroides pyogenes JCM 6292 TaxID=1235809 RepID=W4P2Z9_9BACE|nr:ribose 5-phosphate isomerase B [Bacteroides pyogenes JCM 6292]